MLNVLIRLIFAHLIGDFVLQSDRLCRMKYGKSLKNRILALSFHSLLQALLTYIFLGTWDCYVIPLIIMATHFVIDYIKVSYSNNSLPSFLIDQAAHYLVIILLWWSFFIHGQYAINHATAFIGDNMWIMLVSYVAILSPTSILIKLFIDYEKWMPEVEISQGLPNAGKWIGYLERILILSFIFSGNIEGIGFLLAAKSVFRFGELNKAKDIKITEYVLIGTFLSFTIAILIGFVAQWLLTYGHELIG